MGVFSNVGSLVLMKVLIGTVFLGWIMMWVLMPTALWSQQWRTSLREKTNSTYFGTYGGSILIYTFPVMFMSVLGCIYFHLKEEKKSQLQSPDERKKGVKDWGLVGWWSRPIVVRGPFGVVNPMELAFLVMFLLLLIWCFSTYLYVGLPKITMKQAQKDDETLWQAKLSSAGQYLGLTGMIGIAFLFFPVSRGSVLVRLLGLNYEGSVRYHMWMGHTVMAILTLHGFFFVIVWATKNDISEMLEWATDDVANLAGVIALSCGLILWVATIPRIRRKMFELFYYTHHLYVLFFAFFAFHVGPSKIYIFLPGFFLFVVDRFLRFLQSRQSTQLVAARILPCEVVELTFSKRLGLVYNPMSTVFVNVPSISPLQWHPFTVTSSSNLESETLSVAVKCEGSWSQLLYHRLTCPSRTTDRLEVAVEGPYAPPTNDMLRHDVLIMVSGGIGVTPFASIIRHMIAEKTVEPKIVLVCAFKHSRELAILDILLPSSFTSEEADLNLQIQAYVTRENNSESEPKSQPSTQIIHFKLNSKDVPFSRPLGPNHWLWTGIVITASFSLFLVLMGVFFRFYIYPKQEDTEYTYPLWLHGLFIMLFMCISIFIVGFGACLWNKKRSSQEDQRIKNVAFGTPMETPNSNYNFGETDVERSSSQGPLVEFINVEYGARPDLKKIIGEYEGRGDVGVVVCGPQGMRSDAAAVCAASQTKNLHFHGVSFDW